MHIPRSRLGWLPAIALAVALTGCRLAGTRPACVPAAVTAAPTPISMAALHQSGGVPPGWRFALPPGNAAAGRQVFVDFGCFSCHAVQGEQFPSTPEEQNHVGPDLTGMGSHHPAEYLAQAIIDPNAVLIGGPGYIGADGLSIMPTYGDMTLAQLTDLVAYLLSLKGEPSRHVHSHPGGGSFFVQAVEITADQFDAFEEWFAQRGANELKAVEGLMSVDTYVSRTPAGRLLVLVFGFEDDAVLHDFVERLQSPQGADGLGTLLQIEKRSLLRSPPVYKAIGLSLP